MAGKLPLGYCEPQLRMHVDSLAAIFLLRGRSDQLDPHAGGVHDKRDLATAEGERVG